MLSLGVNRPLLLTLIYNTVTRIPSSLRTGSPAVRVERPLPARGTPGTRDLPQEDPAAGPGAVPLPMASASPARRPPQQGKYGTLATNNRYWEIKGRTQIHWDFGNCDKYLGFLLEIMDPPLNANTKKKCGKLFSKLYMTHRTFL